MGYLCALFQVELSTAFSKSVKLKNKGTLANTELQTQNNQLNHLIVYYDEYFSFFSVHVAP